jgi:hypothetical protein
MRIDGMGRGGRTGSSEDRMKKYIREMIEDLRGPKVKVNPVVAADLSNQELSKNPEERVKQLDYQAQQSERRQTGS